MLQLEFSSDDREAQDSVPPVPSPSTLGAFAAPFFDQAGFSDVVVVCQNKTFRCHKIILAGRSDVFKVMLSSKNYLTLLSKSILKA